MKSQAFDASLYSSNCQTRDYTTVFSDNSQYTPKERQYCIHRKTGDALGIAEARPKTSPVLDCLMFYMKLNNDERFNIKTVLLPSFSFAILSI